MAALRQIPHTENASRFLEQQGYSVWWDTSLVGGDAYHKVIVAEIKACKAAVVIWTPASVQSDWVYSEATRAHRRKKLVPVKVADLDVDDIPAPFDALHIIDYDSKADWTSAIAKHVGHSVDGIAPSAPAAPLPTAAKPEARKKAGWFERWTTKSNPSSEPMAAQVSVSPDARVARGWQDIFISYRRADSASAHFVRDMLRQHFTQGPVFMDIDNITPGMNFASEIERNIDKSDATLVIIGPQWSSARNTHGERRIDDPNDFVMREIAMALQTGKLIKTFHAWSDDD